MSDLTLSAAERELAAEETRAVLAAAPAREDVAALVEAVDAAAVPPELAPLLEQVVELGLGTGRIRAVYGPTGEATALRLHRRLPGGAEATARTRAVSEALSALEGRQLDGISVVASGPGTYALTISAGGAELSVRLDRSGARLASVGV